MEEVLRFVPSRVEGLPDVREVAVFPDRLELLSAGKWVVVRLRDIAKWPRPCWFWRFIDRIGWRPRSLSVGERDWFHAPRDRFFAFYKSPPLVVYMPDEAECDYAKTCFVELQKVIRRGGFDTYDLG
jgi:hypothetical protein